MYSIFRLKLALLLASTSALLLSSCDQDVLTFPTPLPASIRVVNTTTDVDTLTVLIDASVSAFAPIGLPSSSVVAPAGRPISFVLMEGDTALRRDTLYYTLGGSGKIILFTRGSKQNLVEFRRVIQDTTLPAGSRNSVIRFTHMAENVDQFVTLEVWIKEGDRLFPEDYDPGLSSPSYTGIAPGKYTFEIREYGTTNVAAVISDFDILPGKSYMLYTFDAQPVTLDNVGFSIFD